MRWPAPMAASSKWGETTRMRANAAGSTSPHVGSAKAALMAGSYGHVVDRTGHVAPEDRHEEADDGRADDAGQAARHHGELDAGQRGHGSRLHVAEARAALHDGHLDGGHPAAEALGDGTLENGVAQDGGDDVGPPGHRQHH